MLTFHWKIAEFTLKIRTFQANRPKSLCEKIVTLLWTEVLFVTSITFYEFFLKVIHTASGEIGVPYSCGHIDFWPSGGNHQSACTHDSSCDHGIVYRYWMESLKSNRFVAHKCDNWANYQAGKCKGNPTAIMGTLTIGSK